MRNPGDKHPRTSDLPAWIWDSWKNSKNYQRWIFVLAGLLLLIFSLEILGDGVISTPALRLVEDAYNDASLPIVNLAFDQIAERQQIVPLESYLSKTSRWLDRLTLGILISSAVLMLVSARATLGKEFSRIGYRMPFLMIGAAVFLSLATAVRIAGPFAGILVLIYFLMRFRGKFLWLLVPYFGFAYVTTFFLWPALWVQPIGHLIETYNTMSQFPSHRVLYLGSTLDSASLPPHFIPVLLVLQFSEPIFPLFAIGLVAYAWSSRTKFFTSNPTALVVAIWIGVPLLAIIVLSLPNYGNFRHYLFIVPPIFLFAAFGLQRLFDRLHSRQAKLAIAAVFIIPGVISLTKLHPYEYAYYNSLIRGVRGADGNFEL